MSQSLMKNEESRNNNQINNLLNSPIISKRIPEIQPSPLVLCSKKKVSDNNILENEKEKKINIIESISNQETDNEVNSNEQENFFQEKQENIKNEGKKLCILDMLKKISRKNIIRKLQ